jgi:Fe(3+) dicitrate transport protein
MKTFAPARPIACVAAFLAAMSQLSPAQQPDSATIRRGTLPSVVVTASRPLHVIGHMPAVEHNVVLTGKKTEVIVMDSLRANIAQDVERQILGRIPGAHFSETEGAGFPSNGVAFRGLDPTQSVEMNVRQNGVNIAADLFGYPETYYTPPSEALERIDVVRGAGALAFGPQFGGVIDYVVRDGQRNTVPQFSSSLTGGSFGFVNSFNSVSGGTDKMTYYAFVHGRRGDGWRPNSDSRQLAAFGRMTYRPTSRLMLGAEYTVFRNRIHMAGGLDDSAFAVDPRASFRARNWLASPWNIAALRANYEFSQSTRVENTLSYVDGSRALVWRNEDGGPAAPDLIDPETGERIPRELEDETFKTLTLESRLRVDHTIGARHATLAAGLRLSGVSGRRFEGGTGSSGSDFDMRLAEGTWETALHLGTTNAAAFAEELVHLSDRLGIVPGLRLERIRSTISGNSEGATAFAPRTYSYPLAGIGADYMTNESTALYANISQAYRPILYSAFTPVGTIARIDPALHSSRGLNADFGWRGTVHDVIKFDVGAFYLWYGDRIGTRTGTDASGEFVQVTNIGDSEHRGVESYLELDPFPLLGLPARVGALDLFSSFAYVDARYVSGEFKGNRVEQAPRVLARFGTTYGLGRISTTLQVSHTSSSFGDANNSVRPTEDATGGLIPAYTLLDLSASARVAQQRQLTLGVNNLTDARYFTKRTAEYPGPGILPGIGRSFYVGIRAAF